MTESELRNSINAAAAHHSARRFNEAEKLYRQILAERPLHLDALHLLGTLCAQTGRRPEGIELMTRACEVNPNFVPLRNNLGVALRAAGQIDQAIAVFNKTIEIDPSSAETHNNIGIAFRLAGRTDEAITAHSRALELKPDLADAWTNLGMSRADKGQYAEALALSQRAVELDPSHARARLNLAILQLQLGDFERGWPGYEWRWKCADLTTPRPFMQPAWDGSNLAGRTIFVHAEQGYGDTLQFVRFVPLVAARGGRVLLECQKPLHHLLHGFPGIEALLAPGEPLPPFDVQCPLLSLANRFAATPATIPPAPYLRADAALVEHCRSKVAAAAGETLKVGLAWAGQPKHPNDRNRSMRLAQLAPLAATGATFFSLLRGPSAVDVVNSPPGMRLIDFSAEWADFSDTAALIANLDLVISVDTSAAHLAGAMGKPVWTLLPFNADWRWLLNRDDSPWYPGMRLFRQRKAGDWSELIERVRAALSEWGAAHASLPLRRTRGRGLG